MAEGTSSEPGQPPVMRDTAGRFVKGASGNALGRRRGIVDRRSKLRHQLESQGGQLVSKLLELAKGGDREALQFCLSRLIPVARETEETASLPIPQGASLGDRIKAVSHAALTGSLSPALAQQLARVLAAEASVTEIADLSERLSRLEAKQQ